MPKCIKCNRVKTANLFYPDPQNRNGLQHDCKECRKADVRKYQRKNSTKILESLRVWRKDHPDKVAQYSKRAVQKIRVRAREFYSNSHCVNCRTTKSLVLHHIDPDKKTVKRTSTYDIWGWSEKRRQAELNLCVVLCKSCHAKVHHNLRKQNKNLRKALYHCLRA